ncbi:MAG: AraC family transcriptional regulator [Deltaproteobacteria bacterium]|nr:AraC family transcriptional regulator [Deltaproteobacteria bacterium]
MTNEHKGSPSGQARRKEYLARIHRVMDFIEKNLDRELGLEELARVACFSSFHFHRVFTSITGESLYQFVLRLRLEKAASQLRQLPDKSVTAIALDCGFSSSSTFARAFRASFGVTASEWRQSKDCKSNRKGWEEGTGSSAYGDGCAERESSDGETQPRSDDMNTPVKVKEARSIRVEMVDAMPVAYVRHVGPYAGDAALFGRLFGTLMRWAGPRGLVGPQTKSLVIYHDNPDITAEDKRRISACVSVPPGTQAEGEVGIMEIPAGKYAFAGFEVDSSEFGAAWAWVYGKWLPESGYQPDDRPCYELCLNDPSQHPEKKHVVEICVPVKPL